MSNNYKKWLFVSDIDGTLNDKRLRLPENNRLAIADYVRRGGNFTLASGRNLQSLAIHYKKLGVETPAIFLNGAGIYDFSENKMLKYNPITAEGEEVVLNTLAENKFLQLTIFTPNKLYRVKRSCLYGYYIAKIDNLDCELCKTTADIPRGNWGKVTFCGLPKQLAKLQVFFNAHPLFQCFLTSPYSLEIVKKGVNKGNALLELSEILGIENSNTAAIGDYYNDVDMLKVVGHPACCGQAPDDIKSLCEYVACHCNDGAVADFLGYIQNKYIEE